VLENQNRFENFVQRELHVPGLAGFGIYLYSNKLLAPMRIPGLGHLLTKPFMRLWKET